MGDRAKEVVDAFTKLNDIEQAHAQLEIDRLWREWARREMLSGQVTRQSAGPDDVWAADLPIAS